VPFRACGAQSAETLPLVAPVMDDSFGGGCSEALIAHLIKAHRGEAAFENTARDYLHVMRVTQAAYRSDRAGCKIAL